jgi:hypothetical protein
MQSIKFLYSKGSCVKYLSFLILLLLVSGCSKRSFSEQAAERVLENVTNTDISYNGANCPNVRKSCSRGNYEEWRQKNGKMACACNK